MKRWNWWVYRVWLAIGISGVVWKQAGLTYGTATFLVVFLINCSAYYDGISVGEWKAK